jgi:hypothetical protein
MQEDVNNQAIIPVFRCMFSAIYTQMAVLVTLVCVTSRLMSASVCSLRIS